MRDFYIEKFTKENDISQEFQYINIDLLYNLIKKADNSKYKNLHPGP